MNVARGGVIDDEALNRALDAGIVAQAALDVFSKEPPTDNPLVGRADVICTPHLGASTVEAQEDVAVEIAEAVVEALQVCFQTTPILLLALVFTILCQVWICKCLQEIQSVSWEKEHCSFPDGSALLRIWSLSSPKAASRLHLTVHGL